ncbi:hypothetical protein RBB50_011102 [Rhinocladiella similis]
MTHNRNNIPPLDQRRDLLYRESALFATPPIFAVSDVEREPWLILEQEAFEGPHACTFQQLLVILLLHLVPADGIQWSLLHEVFHPGYDSRTQRLKVLRALSEMSRSSFMEDFQIEAEAWRNFLRPIVNQDHPLLKTPRSERIFRAASIRDISAILDRLGLHLDDEPLLDFRYKLQAILPRQLLRLSMVNVPLSLESCSNLIPILQEMGSELESVDPRYIAVIAWHRSKGLFLPNWVQTLDAAYLVQDVVQRFGAETSQLKRVVLLLVGYIIHLHLFGAMNTTGLAEDTLKQLDRLPDHLHREGVRTFGEALSSYAQVSGLTIMLDSLVPGNSSSLNISAKQCEKWKHFWNERFLIMPRDVRSSGTIAEARHRHRTRHKFWGFLRAAFTGSKQGGSDHSTQATKVRKRVFNLAMDSRW